MKAAGRVFLLILLGSVLGSATNTVLGFVVLKRLEKKSGAPIKGQFVPHLFAPSFSLKQAKVEWQKRFRVDSGTFTVRYDPLSVLPGRKLRTWIEGRDLEARLFGELAESEGFSDVRIDRVRADLAFFRKGPPEIFAFDVQSPQIQFHMTKEGGP